MKTERRKNFIINCIYFAILLGVLIVLIRIGFPVLMPFVIAFIVSLLLAPLAKRINRYLPVSRGLISIILVTLFYAVAGALIILSGIQISKALIGLINLLPDFYSNTVEPWLRSLVTSMNELLKRLPEGTVEEISASSNELISGLGTMVTNFSLRLITILGTTATSVPGFLIKVVITVVATVFFTIDGEMIWNFILNQFSYEKADLIVKVTVSMKKILGKYIVSYAIIMLITFLELFAGFLIIGIEKPGLIAGMIAVFDILPIVGSGLITCPWAIFSLIDGNTGRGIGLLIIWAVISVVRNIMEPKIVGGRVGLHPLVTLMAMVVGTFVFGGIGILLVPVGMAVIQNLNSSGVVHIYNPVPQSENGQKESTLKIVLNRIKKRKKDRK